jgi:hypothetical protein
MEARKMPGSCGAGMWGKTPHLLPSSRMAQTRHPLLWWGMKPTVSGKYLLDQHPEPYGASSTALNARESTDGNPQGYVGPIRSASFPTEVNDVATRFVGLCLTSGINTPLVCPEETL